MNRERREEGEPAGSVLFRVGSVAGLALSAVVMALALYRGAPPIGAVELAMLALLTLSGCGWLAACCASRPRGQRGDAKAE